MGNCVLFNQCPSTFCFLSNSVDKSIVKFKKFLCERIQRSNGDTRNWIVFNYNRIFTWTLCIPEISFICTNFKCLLSNLLLFLPFIWQVQRKWNGFSSEKFKLFVLSQVWVIAIKRMTGTIKVYWNSRTSLFHEGNEVKLLDLHTEFFDDLKALLEKMPFLGSQGRIHWFWDHHSVIPILVGLSTLCLWQLFSKCRARKRGLLHRRLSSS